MRKLLTPLTVARIKGGDQRREVADAGMPGLYLVIQPQPTSAKSWAVRYRYGKRTRKHTLGQYPLLDLGKARQRAKDALEAIERGEDPAAEKISAKRRQHLPSADRHAFGVLLRQFFHRHAIPRTKSWRETARLLGMQLEAKQPGSGQPLAFIDLPGRISARWAERPVSSIRRRDIIELLDESKDRGATTTANRELGVLRKFFAWCVEREVLEVNPAIGIGKPAPETRRERVLSDDELRIVWRAAEEEAYPFGHLVRLLILTAQRRNEVAGAIWREFDLKASNWVLPAERTKNARAHAVPLSEGAVAVLKDIPRFAGGGFLFGVAGRSNFSGFSKAKRRLDKRIAELRRYEGISLDIAGWTLHDLRRTAATRMADIGVLPHVVEAVLNHSSGSKAGVAGTYNRSLYEPEKRIALKVWSEFVERLGVPNEEDKQ